MFYISIWQIRILLVRYMYSLPSHGPIFIHEPLLIIDDVGMSEFSIPRII